MNATTESNTLLMNDTDILDFLEMAAQRAWTRGESLTIMPPKGAVTLRDAILLFMDDAYRLGDEGI